MIRRSDNIIMTLEAGNGDRVDRGCRQAEMLKDKGDARTEEREAMELGKSR